MQGAWISQEPGVLAQLGGGGGPRLPQALGRAGGPVHRVLGRLPDPMAWQEGR